MYDFLIRFSSAVLGAILFTALWLLDLAFWSTLLALIGGLLGTGIYLLIQMGPINAFFSMLSSVLEEPFTALTLFVLMPIYAILAIPLVIENTFYSLLQLFLAPFKGAYHGYHYGIGDVLEGCSMHLENHSAWLILINNVRGIQDADPLVSWERVSPAHQRATRPAAPFEYSSEEWNALLARGPILSTEEKARCSAYSENSEIGIIYARYLGLETRLSNNECPIFRERPARNDVIILVKQYQDGTQWRAVPGQSYVFDRGEFNRHLATQINPSNPLTQEPLYHANRHQGRETRFRIHSFYGDAHPEGFSQELSEQAAQLRGMLPAPSQKPPQTEYPSRSARSGSHVRFYGQTNSATPRRDLTERTTPYYM